MKSIEFYNKKHNKLYLSIMSIGLLIGILFPDDGYFFKLLLVMSIFLIHSIRLLFLKTIKVAEIIEDELLIYSRYEDDEIKVQYKIKLSNIKNVIVKCTVRNGPEKLIISLYDNKRFIVLDTYDLFHTPKNKINYPIRKMMREIKNYIERFESI